MPGLRDESFPAKCRLRRSNDFRRIFHRGYRTATPFCVIYSLPNNLEHSRLGIQVRRKVGSAVERNRIKRRTREGFRRLRGELRESLDLIVIAEQAMVRMSSADVEQFLRSALHRYLK